MSEKTQPKLNLMQRLAKIRQSVDVLNKSEKGYGYNYVPEEEILARIKTGMEEYGISLYPSIVPGTMTANPFTYDKTRVTKGGQAYDEHVNEVLVKADEAYTWVVDETGESLAVPWGLVGQQSDGAQAFGSGLTYSNRYFLLKFFNSATTDDDPDNWRRKKQDAADEAERLAVEAIIEEIDKFARSYIQAHPERSTKVAAVAKKYAKDGDYTEIKEPILAGKLLDELRETFKEEG